MQFCGGVADDGCTQQLLVSWSHTSGPAHPRLLQDVWSFSSIPPIIYFVTAKAGNVSANHCIAPMWAHSWDSQQFRPIWCSCRWISAFISSFFLFFLGRGLECLKAALYFKDWSALSPPKQCNGKLYFVIALSGAHLIKDISNMLILMENHLSCLAVRSYFYFLFLIQKVCLLLENSGV